MSTMMIRERKEQRLPTGGISKGRLWTARIMSGIGILFMLMDGIGKLTAPAPVVEATLALGFAERHMVVMGVLGLLSTLLYAIPRTSFLGGLLLTGYLGGAIAAQVRVDAPLFSSILFSVYLALLFWGALWLRDERVRNLFAPRR
ncbi:DoxX family protein [Paenibacillus aurantius]|uniref:DoxX family protein n=1 Tax=Paenibacillus aurantius TaxID=2918900 RepID=A0AA96LCM2_9BACL|nr:DoxX family protein [Paenibacillus aurantius]WNQ10699.1 DoxX family protein [Paenibacillus aurantius]